MKILVLALGILAACDPIYGVNVKLRDPGGQPVDDATLAIACADGSHYAARHAAARSKPTGEAHVGGMGSMWPMGCDVFVAKRGFRTHRIPYRDICPKGAEDCDRVFHFDIVLEPE